MPYAGNLGNALVSALIAAASFSHAPAPLYERHALFVPKADKSWLMAI
jgi:hypothetical protein